MTSFHFAPALPMKHRASHALLLALASLLPLAAAAGPVSSANYSIAANSIDAGGGAATSAAYRNDGCLGGVVGVSTVASPVESARHGYIGQLYQIASIMVSANPTNVDEGATRQLQVQANLDDGTVLVPGPSSVSWSVAAGPIQSINAAGLATAAHVYQDTMATAQASFRGQSGTLGLLVRNVSDDDFGTYAGDGLNDAWQVQHFGESNPSGLADADPDGDGQSNAYEEMVGSIPTDGTSYFRFRIETVPGHADWMNLIFSPRVAGRTYTIEAKPDLDSGAFSDIGPAPIADVGIERIITDHTAAGATKYYRVQISRP
jgi:hypothetical protein